MTTFQEYNTTIDSRIIYPNDPKAIVSDNISIARDVTPLMFVCSFVNVPGGGTDIIVLQDNLNGGWNQVFNTLTDYNNAGYDLSFSNDGTRYIINAALSTQILIVDLVNNVWTMTSQVSLPVYNLGFFNADGLFLAKDLKTRFALGNDQTNEIKVYEETSLGSGVWNELPNTGPNAESLTGNNSDYYGFCTLISGDGSILAVGAPYQENIIIGSFVYQNGYVKVYQYDTINSQWLLKGNPIVQSGTNANAFGSTLDLNEAKDILVVGSPKENNDTGKVYIYNYDGSDWINTSSLDSLYPSVEQLFGFQVKINQTGNIVSTITNRYDKSVFSIYKNSGSNTWVRIGNDVYNAEGIDVNPGAWNFSSHEMKTDSSQYIVRSFYQSQNIKVYKLFENGNTIQDVPIYTLNNDLYTSNNITLPGETYIINDKENTGDLINPTTNLPDNLTYTNYSLSPSAPVDWTIDTNTGQITIAPGSFTIGSGTVNLIATTSGGNEIIVPLNYIYDPNSLLIDDENIDYTPNLIHSLIPHIESELAAKNPGVLYENLTVSTTSFLDVTNPGSVNIPPGLKDSIIPYEIILTYNGVDTPYNLNVNYPVYNGTADIGDLNGVAEIDINNSLPTLSYVNYTFGNNSLPGSTIDPVTGIITITDPSLIPSSGTFNIIATTEEDYEIIYEITYIKTGEIIMNTILNGIVDPTDEGNDGDFYINTITNTLFGPKSNGEWPTNGIQLGCCEKNTIISGAGLPTDDLIGDFYVDTNTGLIYGPKINGSWNKNLNENTQEEEEIIVENIIDIDITYILLILLILIILLYLVLKK